MRTRGRLLPLFLQSLTLWSPLTSRATSWGPVWYVVSFPRPRAVSVRDHPSHPTAVGCHIFGQTHPSRMGTPPSPTEQKGGHQHPNPIVKLPLSQFNPEPTLHRGLQAGEISGCLHAASTEVDLVSASHQGGRWRRRHPPVCPPSAGPTLTQDDLILSRSHLPRPYFLTRPPTQGPRVRMHTCLFGGRGGHNLTPNRIQNGGSQQEREMHGTPECPS